jgi:hypothetical protein
MPCNYNQVCFECRYTTKGGSRCPHCRKPLVSMYYKWRFPPRRDIKGWKKTLEMIRNHNMYWRNLLRGI